MGARADQARAEVTAAREGLVDETEALRGSAFEAVNLPARAREDPVRYGAIVAGGLFLALGGPRRLLRRARRAVLGAPAPKSLLPEEIERAVEGLGRDSESVKRHLEREFANYLEERQAEREKSALTGTLLAIAGTAVNRAASEASKRIIEEFLASRDESPSSAAASDVETAPPASTGPAVARGRGRGGSRRRKAAQG
jgi:hypothetical protein